MSIQPETTRYKYTDRDVRENPDLIAAAENYLRQYQGDFEWLRDAKKILFDHDIFPIGTARGVLNCMRTDARAIHLLTVEPKGYTAAEVKENVPKVTPIFSTRKRKGLNRDYHQCRDVASHGRHWWREQKEDGSYEHECTGIPWEINRKWRTRTEANIKYSYLMAKSGKLLHRTSGEGHVDWHPHDEHRYGYGYTHLYVKTQCKYASSIKDARLFKEMPDIAVLASIIPGIKTCSQCFETGSTDSV